MVYDTFYNNIYFIANYQTEVDKALDEANTGKGQKYISPDTHIYLLENDKLKKIYSSNRKLCLLYTSAYLHPCSCKYNP